MAETAPNASNPDSFPKGLDIYESFDQVTTGNVRKKTTPIGVAEDGTRVPLTDEHILHSYGYGPEDLPPKAAKKNKQWVKPIEVIDASEEIAEDTSEEKLVPADDFKEKHSVETEDGFPMKGLWEGHSGDQPVTVEKSYGIGGDGKIYYKISESDTGVPADQLKFYVPAESSAPDTAGVTPLEDVPEPQPESPDDKKPETTKNLESLSAKEKALHPETIIQLKEKAEARLKSQMKDLEVLSRTGRLAERYEKARESTEDLIFAAVAQEYLDNLSEEDRNDVDALFEDIIHRMKESMESLEIQRQMMKGLASAEEEEPKTRTVIEPEPIAVTPEPVVVTPEPTAVEPGTTITSEWPTPAPREEPAAASTEVDERSWLRKKWDRVKYIAGWPAEKFVTYMVIEGDPNSPENQKKRRRTKLGLIAGVILVPVALLAAYKLGLNHNGGGSGNGAGHGATGTEGTPDIDSGTGTTPYGPEAPGAHTALGGSHHEVFNNDHGTRTVESILPDNLKQSPVTGAGYEQITDKNTGQVLVDHVTYASNGRYSTQTINDLHGNGYNVGTNTIEVNDTTGPGPHGDITHKVSVVQKA